MREPGYYHVDNSNRASVAYWDGIHWYIAGRKDFVESHFFNGIGERVQTTLEYKIGVIFLVIMIFVTGFIVYCYKDCSSQEQKARTKIIDEEQDRIIEMNEETRRLNDKSRERIKQTNERLDALKKLQDSLEDNIKERSILIEPQPLSDYYQRYVGDIKLLGEQMERAAKQAIKHEAVMSCYKCHEKRLKELESEQH